MSNLTLIAPQCAASDPTTLVLKEKKLSLTGDSATIKDVNGNVVFKINAHLMSLSCRRELMDANGTMIGQLRKKKTPQIHQSYYFGPMDNDKKCSVKKKGLMNITKCDADIFLGSTKIGEAHGNWRSKSFDIFIDGNQAGKVSRKTNLSSVLLDSDEYVIEVSAGVDAAFITLIIISLDELYSE